MIDRAVAESEERRLRLIKEEAFNFTIGVAMSAIARTLIKCCIKEGMNKVRIKRLGEMIKVVPTRTEVRSDVVKSLKTSEWECYFDEDSQSWYWYNSFSGEYRWDNPL